MNNDQAAAIIALLNRIAAAVEKTATDGDELKQLLKRLADHQDPDYRRFPLRP